MIKLVTGEYEIGKYKVIVTASNISSGAGHHGNLKYSILKDSRTVSNFHINTANTGCGCVILSNMTGLDQAKIVLKELFKTYLASGVGSILTIYGAFYFEGSNYKALEELGFKVISEYINHRHSETYKQRLLQLIL